jgi:hypothetical protein
MSLTIQRSFGVAQTPSANPLFVGQVFLQGGVGPASITVDSIESDETLWLTDSDTLTSSAIMTVTIADAALEAYIIANPTVTTDLFYAAPSPYCNLNTQGPVPSTLNIKGTIKYSNDIAVSGVTVTADGHSANTNSSGVFLITGISTPFTGTVTPSKTGHIFDVASVSFTSIYNGKRIQNPYGPEWFTDVSYPGKANNPNPSLTFPTIISSSPTDITLSWGAAAPAPDHYNVYFGPAGSMTQIGTNQTQNIKVVNVTVGTTYDWRIDTILQTRVTTGDVWTFTADSLAIALDEPENNTSYGGTVFSWTKTGTATPDHYVLYIEDFNPATDPNSPYIIGPINALIKDIAPSTLVVGSTYLWIVFAQDAGNNDIGLSDTWYFTVAPLSKPVNPTPGTATTRIPITTVRTTNGLKWEDGNQSNPATTYNATLSDPQRGGVIYTQNDIPAVDMGGGTIGAGVTVPDQVTVGGWTFAPFVAGHTYTWKIDAVGPQDADPDVDREIVPGDSWTFRTSFPIGSGDDRPSDYNADDQWQYSDGEYGWFGIDVAGGGRYKRSLIIIGHRCVYVSM